VGDTSLSAYEFHLAKACFCVGLATDQAETVIKWWWKHHNLTGRSEKKLVKAIIPAAWRDVAEYVVGWKAAHRSVYTTTCITTDRETANPEGRPVSARTLLVLRLADENPSWGIARIALDAVVSRQSAWIALHRHRPGRVYTTTCITTDTGAVMAIEAVPAPAADDEAELMTPEDARVDLDALDAEYAAAVAAGMFDDEPVEEEIEAPVLVMRPAEAIIKAILPDFDDYLELELVTTSPIVEEEWPFGTRESRALARAEWKAQYKLENREILREYHKRSNHHSLAELKREATAKKRVRGYASQYAPSPQDLYLEKINDGWRPDKEGDL
jgi:hypothetical protein